MAGALATFAAEAERARAGRRTVDPSWLTAARREAAERFQTLGFPTTRDEEWRFTSVAPIAEQTFALATNGAASLSSSDLEPMRFGGEISAELVFVNGRFVSALSSLEGLPRGVHADGLARAIAARPGAVEQYLTRLASLGGQAFTALNSAFLLDGAFVQVADSVSVPAPIHLLFLTTGAGRATMAHPRVLIVVGAQAHASVVETYGALQADGAAEYLTNAVTEIVVGDNAGLDHYKVQRESLAGYHVGSTYLRTSRDSNVTSHSISLGGSLVRNDVNAVLDGEGGVCTLNGLYLCDVARHVDNHTTIDHAWPHCDSREVYKGILADRARAVFNGKIIVRPDAQKTDAKQTNKALLLSRDAQINTKPQLEIFANDVKCTHGAAVGQMDEEAIFYLRARGLSEPEARHLLIHAFAGDVLNRMPLEPLRARLDAEVLRRLPR